MASGRKAKRLPVRGGRTAAGLVLAVSGVQMLQTATAVNARADEANEANEAPDNRSNRGRDRVWQIKDWLSRNVPTHPDGVRPDASMPMAKRFVAWINQKLILDGIGSPPMPVSPQGAAGLTKDLAAAAAAFWGERARMREQDRIDAARTVLGERSSAVADYIAESERGAVSPETMQRYVATGLLYEALPEQYRHLEINEFAGRVTQWRRQVDGSPFGNPQTDPALAAYRDGAVERYHTAVRTGTLTDAIEYEMYKAVSATSPNMSAETLRTTNFLDWQEARYSGRLPRPGSQGWPGSPGPDGGDPAGRGPTTPRPVTNGPSGGAAEPPRGGPAEGGTSPGRHEGNTPEGGREGPSESSGRGGGPEDSGRPGAGKPPVGAEKPTAGKPAAGKPTSPDDPVNKPVAPDHPAAKPVAPDDPTAKPKPAPEGEAKPGAPGEEPGKPAPKPGDSASAKPGTPKSIAMGANGPFARGFKAGFGNPVFLAVEVALAGLEGKLASDYMNWMVRRAQQDPAFVDRYLEQYAKWETMNWLERRQFEIEHFFGDGLTWINSVAFTPEMADYMRAMQTFYRTAPPDPGMTATEGTVTPYTGGAQTTDAADRWTLGPDGNWHDKSKVYLLTERDKTAAPSAPEPPVPQTPQAAQPPPAERPPATTPPKPKPSSPRSDNPRPGQTPTAQQRVQNLLDADDRKPGKPGGGSRNSVNPDRSDSGSDDSRGSRLGEGGGRSPSGGGSSSGGDSSGGSSGASGNGSSGPLRQRYRRFGRRKRQRQRYERRLRRLRCPRPGHRQHQGTRLRGQGIQVAVAILPGPLQERVTGAPRGGHTSRRRW